MLTKQDVLLRCVSIVQNRINEIKTSIADVENSLISDTKSSAGDKYETSREMLQQDLNRYSNQLVIAENDMHVLKNIDPFKSQEVARPGALIQTEQALYFISISVGRLEINEDTVFIISAQSPLGQTLLGLKVGDFINFKTISSRILMIQ